MIELRGDTGPRPQEVAADTASAIAEDFLADKVGDLLMAEEPRLVDGGRPRWEFAVTLGNAVRGHLGRVGTIAVDAETGEILFDEDERARVLANAERVSRSPAP